MADYILTMHDRFQLLLRRRFRWFISSETAKEQYIPAQLSGRVLLFSATAPGSCALTIHWHRLDIVLWNLALLIMNIAMDVGSYRYFRMGMNVGRIELVAEMIDAWVDSDLDPREYLVREALLGQAEEFRSRPIIRPAPVDPPDIG